MQSVTERLRKFRDDRDWSQFHTPKDLALSISVEASELLEIFQWKPESTPVDEEMKRAIEDEVADIFSYLLLFCDKTDINLVEVTNKKIDANQQRFPADASRGIAKPRKEV
ncbi:nucleotide pyrophosphohydrolase [Pseudooceanicola sp. HF7]|uniref:nucleotide pyrophosphohydrolase n=1 Tax=Pseudooceanicola sp. HF7 TaxID=2721560 RepID=UPI001431F904|nr:nucleotide pyrophosphohydrolase [Pseudooceanicola sp. HF7]NIZ11106.1 nucleotide pyrophosphohydrolase [Pseudooceanicola sp. HF7]